MSYTHTSFSGSSLIGEFAVEVEKVLFELEPDGVSTNVPVNINGWGRPPLIDFRIESESAVGFIEVSKLSSPGADDIVDLVKISSLEKDPKGKDFYYILVTPKPEEGKHIPSLFPNSLADKIEFLDLEQLKERVKSVQSKKVS